MVSARFATFFAGLSTGTNPKIQKFSILRESLNKSRIQDAVGIQYTDTDHELSPCMMDMTWKISFTFLAWLAILLAILEAFRFAHLFITREHRRASNEIEEALKGKQDKRETGNAKA
ncbi:hypothetical protein N7486_005153 [Penicillium sp. IBT 16267x]|nr:hypothetical protein N7486_005153 [Penicillium sp. IBT 16267x]